MRSEKAFAVALALALSIPALVASPAVAQTSLAGSGDAIALSQIKVIAESANQSIFEINFGGKLASTATNVEDAMKPSIFVARARRGNVGAQSNYRGLVRGLSFEQTESGLNITFAANAPSKIVASQSGPQQLLVTITKLSAAEAANYRPPKKADVAEATGGSGTANALPQAYAPPPGEDGFELIMLKYADVSEIVGLLTDGITIKPNNIFIRREPGFGSPGSNNGYSPAPQGDEREQMPLGQAVDSNIAVDRRLNAIWVRGSAERIARIRQQIAMIDIPVDSVILETQFVELTEQGARNIGIDFANANGQVAVGTASNGQFVPFGFDPDRTLLSGQVQAAIYAQIQKGEGKIISKPRIVAQSGATAKIITGDALPILTAITLSGVNGVSQQVQYVNVGVTLQIAPRVSPDGFVTSNIYGVVSSVTGFSQGYPTISQREAETSVSVKDGETFIIGGLTQENLISNKSKIPLLGDIPLIGKAFSVEKTTKSKTELYIVITPYIVRHRRFEQQADAASAGDAAYPQQP